VYGANVCAEARGVCVFGDRDRDLDVIGGASSLKLCSCLRRVSLLHAVIQRPAYLQHVLDPAARMALDYALYPDEGLDLCVQAVAHQLELAVWWDEADGPVVLESR